MTAATSGPSGPSLFSMFSGEHDNLSRSPREAFLCSLLGASLSAGTAHLFHELLYP